MANPSSVDGNPVVLEATNAERSVTLDADRAYTLAHDGEDRDGVAATNTIYLAFATGITADETEEDDKFKLMDERSVTVGPGVNTLYFETEAGSPTFSVMPSERKFGKY